jgi:hypothetical protein
MTIGTNTARVSFNCNGVSISFPIPIQAYLGSDFLVQATNTTGATLNGIAAGASVPLNLSSDYSMTATGTLAPPQWTLTTLAGTPWPTGIVFQIILNPTEVQTTQYVQGQAFPSQAVQTNMDRMVQMAIRLSDQIARTIHQPDGDVTVFNTLPAAAARASTLLGFDVNGQLTIAPSLATVLTQAAFNIFLAASAPYAKTAAETTAGVTVVNGFFPPMHVDRYGTNTTPGTTDMSGAFTAAVHVAQINGGTVYYGETGQYMLLNSINCTFGLNANMKGVIIQGPDAGVDSNALSTPSFFPLVAKHTNTAIFDCTGYDAITFKDVAVGTDPTTYPKVGVLTARNTTGESLIFRMTNCKIIGHFSIAPYYNFGSEDDTLISCYFGNYASTADTKTRVYTGSNSHFGIACSFTTDNFGNAVAVSAITVSALEHNSYDCVDLQAGGQTTSDCVYIEASDSGKLLGGVMVNSGASAGGRAHIYVDMTNQASNLWSIDNLTCDNSTHPPQYVLAFSNNAFTPSGFSIRNCRSICTTNCIAALGPLPTIDSLYVYNLEELITRGLSIPGTMQNSTISSYLSMTIGTSTKNNLQGDATAWNITTSTGGSKTHSASKLTFNPGIVTGVNGWTLVGALTQRGTYTYIGNMVSFQITLAGGTSLACVAGATITTLPVKAVATDDMPCMGMDATSKAAYPCYISAGSTTLNMPAITTTADEIIISGTYFVS